MAKTDRWQGLHRRSSLLHSLVATILIIVFLFVSCFNKVVVYASKCIFGKSVNAWRLKRKEKKILKRKCHVVVPRRQNAIFSTVFELFSQ